jgi:hypothetical protein
MMYIIIFGLGSGTKGPILDVAVVTGSYHFLGGKLNDLVDARLMLLNGFGVDQATPFILLRANHTLKTIMILSQEAERRSISVIRTWKSRAYKASSSH